MKISREAVVLMTPGEMWLACHERQSVRLSSGADATPISLFQCMLVAARTDDGDIFVMDDRHELTEDEIRERVERWPES